MRSEQWRCHKGQRSGCANKQLQGTFTGGDFLAEFWVTLQLGVGLDEDVGATVGPAWGEFPGRVH